MADGTGFFRRPPTLSGLDVMRDRHGSRVVLVPSHFRSSWSSWLTNPAATSQPPGDTEVRVSPRILHQLSWLVTFLFWTFTSSASLAIVSSLIPIRNPLLWVIKSSSVSLIKPWGRESQGWVLWIGSGIVLWNGFSVFWKGFSGLIIFKALTILMPVIKRTLVVHSRQWKNSHLNDHL